MAVLYGAANQTIGRFQNADRGTLFLDEIADLRLELQPKLSAFFRKNNSNVWAEVTRSRRISRADAGRIRLRPTAFSAMDLVREAAGLFEVLIEEKGQQITVDGDESVSLTGDRVFLRQALVNIIHNAVKYSPVGGAIQ